jgi:asparagine synthase (glutamine-hydrolysing)
MYADKLSMAHGLEVRVPYLDQEIVHYVECLSASFKIRYGTQKWLHKKVCKQFLPSEIIGRKKRGFAVNVVDDWFRGSLSSSMDNLLLDPGSLIYEFLAPEVVRQTLEQHRSGDRDNHKLLFSLVALEQSLRGFRFSRSSVPTRAISVSN